MPLKQILQYYLDNPINRSIDVEVEVNLTGQLEQPDPDFTFNFPNVNSTIRSELDYRLETRESRENQALFLLSTGSFASELSLGQQGLWYDFRSCECLFQ